MLLTFYTALRLSCLNIVKKGSDASSLFQAGAYTRQRSHKIPQSKSDGMASENQVVCRRQLQTFSGIQTR